MVTDIEVVVEKVLTGKAKLTLATYQYMSHPLMVKFMQDKDVAALLRGVTPEDPFHLLELWAIDGVPQFLLKGKDAKLPLKMPTDAELLEDKKQSEFWEQAEAYKLEFPDLAGQLTVAQEQIASAGCKSCEQRRITGALMQAVHARKTGLVSSIATTPAKPSAVKPRPGCIQCVKKHIAQAIILLQESISGYPDHRWLAVGHMAEAEAESPSLSLMLAIREERLKIMSDEEYIPELMPLLHENT